MAGAYDLCRHRQAHRWAAGSLNIWRRPPGQCTLDPAFTKDVTLGQSRPTAPYFMWSRVGKEGPHECGLSSSAAVFPSRSCGGTRTSQTNFDKGLLLFVWRRSRRKPSRLASSTFWQVMHISLWGRRSESRLAGRYSSDIRSELKHIHRSSARDRSREAVPSIPKQSGEA